MSLVGQTIDGAEVLFDHQTESTRWTIWRNVKTRRINVIIKQGENAVSVSMDNLAKIVREAKQL